MSGALSIQNRQRSVPVNLRLLRRIVQSLLRETCEPGPYELSVCLVGETEMARINETFLSHAGATDVITFDYRSETAPGAGLHGELVICPDQAVAQGRRFRTTWPAELVRYIAHGLLHLRGYDDHKTADRIRMKREENRLVRALGREYDFSQLARLSLEEIRRRS